MSSRTGVFEAEVYPVNPITGEEQEVVAQVQYEYNLGCKGDWECPAEPSYIAITAVKSLDTREDVLDRLPAQDVCYLEERAAELEDDDGYAADIVYDCFIDEGGRFIPGIGLVRGCLNG